MIKSKSVRDNQDEFNRLFLDLENIGVKIDEEDKAVMLWNSLPNCNSTFVETMNYARDDLLFDDVQEALRSKGSENLNDNEALINGDGLITRGWPETRSN